MSEERMLRWSFDRQEIEELRWNMKITEPTSSWDIMEWVIQEVKAEPRRLWMGTWGGSCNGDWENEPPCGTVACFSGWAGLRMFGKLHHVSVAERLAGYEGGFDDDTGRRLKLALHYDLFVDDDLISKGSGEEETVLAVEKRAREIMAEYEDRLRSVIHHPGGYFTRTTKTENGETRDAPPSI